MGGSSEETSSSQRPAKLREIEKQFQGVQLDFVREALKAFQSQAGYQALQRGAGTAAIGELGGVADPLTSLTEEQRAGLVQGYYDRDNRFYVEWDAVARTQEGLEDYLDEWVYGVSGRAEYMEKLGEERKKKLQPEPFATPPVNYGFYR